MMVLPTSNESTVDFAPSQVATRAMTGPRLLGIASDDEGEIRDLLRKRLRIAVTIMLCLMPISLGIRFWMLFELASRGADNWWHWFQCLAVVLVCILILVAAYLVYRKRFVSLAGFRRVEVAVFAVLSLLMSAVQFGEILRGELQRFAVLGDAGVGYRATAQVVSSLVMIAFYGTFIPNTARRCVAITGAMAAAILVATILGLALRPLTPFQNGVAIWVVFFWTGIGVLLAAYGSHRIQTIRNEETNARRLGADSLTRLLGTGGMGEVYYAEHRLLKRPCAIKLIRPEYAAVAASLKRFEREVEAMTWLTHPAAVQVYDFGHAAGGSFYYAMEYLSGLTLEEAVKRSGPMPPERVAAVLVQLCGALTEAHSIGLIHRDIKSANVMLRQFPGRSDAVKLLDFGLVADAGTSDQRLTHAGAILGTPSFMSPEQARGDAVSSQSDLFSLGATAYYLLAGRPPFEGRTTIDVLYAHQNAVLVPSSQVRPFDSPALERIVVRLLAKEPGERFASARDLLDAVKAAGLCGHWTEERAVEWWNQHRGSAQ